MVAEGRILAAVITAMVVIVVVGGVLISGLLSSLLAPPGMFGFPSQRQASSSLGSSVNKSTTTARTGFSFHGEWVRRGEFVYYNSSSLTVSASEYELNSSGNASALYQALNGSYDRSLQVLLSGLLANYQLNMASVHYDSAFVTSYVIQTSANLGTTGFDAAFGHVGGYTFAIVNQGKTGISQHAFSAFIISMLNAMTR